MYEIESFVTFKNEGYVLVEDKSHIWSLAKVIDGKYQIIKDGLLYATNKYVVIDYNGPKIISLETKKMICSGEHLDKIINDIAIYKDGYIFDLKEQKELKLKNYKINYILDNYLILTKMDTKYAIFDTKSKTFLSSILFDSITFSDNKQFLLCYEKEKDISLLYDLYTKECIKTFIGDPITIKGDFLVTSANDLIDLSTLKTVGYAPKGEYEIYGNYAIEKDKFGKRRIIDVFSGKKCVVDTFIDEDTITIKDNYAVVMKKGHLLNNFNYLYDLRKGTRKCFFDVQISLLGNNLLKINTDKEFYLEYDNIIDLNTKKSLAYEEKVRSFYKVGNLLVFRFSPISKPMLKVYNTRERKYIDFPNQDLCYFKELSKDIIKATEFETLDAYITIYTEGGFGAYPKNNKNGEYPRIIDIGLLEKQNLYTTIITLSDMQIFISETSKILHDEKLLLILEKLKNQKKREIMLALLDKDKEEQQRLENFKKKQLQELAEFKMAQRVRINEYKEKLQANINSEITDTLSDAYESKLLREKN